MKKTIDIPDSLYPQIRAASEAAGMSVEAFVLASLQKQASLGKRTPQPPAGLSFAEQIKWLQKNAPAEDLGWEATFGSADPQAIAEVQAVVDREFSEIDPKDWNLPEDGV